MTPERTTELQLYFVYQVTGNDDDVSMFVWAHDAVEAQGLWFASATLLGWNIASSATHVRPVPTEKPQIASVVEWEKLVDYYMWRRDDGELVVVNSGLSNFGDKHK